MARATDIVARQVALSGLLEGIGEGRVVLPDFQRDFDWTPQEVVALVATLLCDWPAGSLLLMRGRPDFFETRSFENAPRQAATIDYVVLDGQQRLTALYLALRGQGPSVYVLQHAELAVDDVPPAEALEELIVPIDRQVWQNKYSLERQAEESLVPLHALSSAADYFEWRDDVAAATPAARRSSVVEALSTLYRGLLGNVNHYDLPAVILDNQLPSAAVARIFERINRTGRRLTTFDLLVARAYAPDWNLRTKWESARRDSEHIDHYLGDDGLPLLQLIALHDLGDVRQPALLRLSPERIREAWDEAVDAMDRALAVARNFGSHDAESVPYKAALLTLAGICWTRPNIDLTQLERWYWAAGLSGGYDVGSSTRVVADYRMLQRVADTDGEVSPPKASKEDLLAATRRSAPAVWRTFRGLLRRARAADPLTRDPVGDEGTVMTLFPPGSDIRSRVFGLMAVERTTARRARGNLLTLISESKPTPSKAMMATQYLPPVNALSPLALAPEDLLEERLALLLGALERSLGEVVVLETAEAR